MEQEVLYVGNCVVIVLTSECSSQMYFYILVTVFPYIALGKLQNNLQSLSDFLLSYYEFYIFCLSVNIKFRVWQCVWLLISGQWSVSNEKLNWTQAMEFCVGVNSTPVLSVPASRNFSQEYWTIKQERVSPWIHIIGMCAPSLNILYSSNNKSDI